MGDPHGVEQDDAEQPPLHRDVQGLVVRIADDLGIEAGLPDRGALELALDRPGAVTDQRRLGNGVKRLAPIGQALRGRGVR